MMSNRFLIMHTTMIMRRKPPTQQSRTKFRTIPLTSKLTARRLKNINSIIILKKQGETSEQNPFSSKHIFQENHLQMVYCFVYDNNTTFLGYQEQKTFSSSHLSNLRNAQKDNLVEWFEPVILIKFKWHLRHKLRANR